MPNKKLIVVGGGFGGFKTTKKLLKKGFDVLLISETDYFTFVPLLVEVATGNLRANDITVKFEDYFKSPNFSFKLAKVTKVNFETNQVITNQEKFSYDYLVLAAGARSRELNIPGSEYALPLKNLSQGLKIKSALLAKIKASPNELKLNVVGAGATGIEFILAAEQLLRARNKKISLKANLFDYRLKLLPAWGENISQYVQKLLKRKKFQLHLNRKVTSITEKSVKIDRNEFPSDLTVLAVGIRPNTDMVDEKYLDAEDYILVDDFLRVKGLSNVFALGDLINFENRIIPKLGQTASSQAGIVAANIAAVKSGKKLQPYNLRLKGRLLSLGAGISVAKLKKVAIKGRLGNFLRCLFFISIMPDWKNKIQLARSWILSALLGINIKK